MALRGSKTDHAGLAARLCVVCEGVNCRYQSLAPGVCVRSFQLGVFAVFWQWRLAMFQDGDAKVHVL